MAVDPDTIEAITRQASAIYREAELAITRAIARHLQEHPDAPTAGVGGDRIEGVRALRRSIESIQANLEADGSTRLREAVAESWRAGDVSALSDVPERMLPESGIGEAAEAARAQVPQTGAIEALAERLVSDIGNRVRNLLRDTLDAYREVVAGASARMLAGGQSRREATQAAWAGLVSRGITGFTDRAGRRWRLSSYTEMAVRTASARAAVEGQTDRLGGLGIDLVVVSDHAQNCPLCRPWEGTILHRASGEVGEITVPHALTDEPVTVTVAGTLPGARAAGLLHPNCRHSISAYLPGVTQVPEPRDPDPRTYEARMRQRDIERRIREWKERDAAALTDAERTHARRRVRAWQREMRDHLDQHPDLKRLRYREQLGAGSTPPRGDTSDPATGLGPDVQPTLDGDGDQVRPTTRRDDQTTSADTAEDRTPGDDQPELEEPPQLPERHRASPDTRDRAHEVIRSLPQTHDDWYALTHAQHRYADERIAQERENLSVEQRNLEELRAEVEAEFRRSRTPHRDRDRLRDERLGDAEARVANAQSWVEEWEEEIAAHERGEATTRPAWMFEPTPTYPRDEAGNRMPPEELQRHLDDVVDVGGRLLGDIDQARGDDEELAAAYQERRDSIEEVNQAYRQELGPEALDARIQRRREAYQRAARREAEIVREVLSDIVDLGGHHQRGGDIADDAPDTWQDQLRTAERYYPTAWLQLADERGPLDVVQDDRQYFLEGRDDRPDRIAFNDRSRSTYRGALPTSAHEVTVHEVGHRMERAVPGLKHLEFALVRRAATRDGRLDQSERLRDATGISAYGDHEVTYSDEWADPYAGKTYEARNPRDPAANSWEIHQMAVQDVWGREGTHAGRDGHRLVLGALATLQNTAPEPPRDPADMTEEELAAELLEAFAAGDLERAEALEAEIDRREAERQAAEARREQQREQRRRRREQREQAQYDEIARLVEQEGMDWDEAAADVLGRSVESIRREEFTLAHRAGEDDRRSFRELARAQYRLELEARYAQAEDATRGVMLTREGQRLGIEPLSLFSGPRARAERYASEELKNWWDANGRQTFAEFVDSIEQGRARGDTGRDFNR